MVAHTCKASTEGQRFQDEAGLHSRELREKGEKMKKRGQGRWGVLGGGERDRGKEGGEQRKEGAETFQAGFPQTRSRVHVTPLPNINSPPHFCSGSHIRTIRKLPESQPDAR